MTTFIAILIAFLLWLGLMFCLNLMIIAFVIINTGCISGEFWKEFKSDLKYSLTHREIIYPIVFGAILLTIVTITSRPSKKCNFGCDYCRGLVHEKIQNN